MILRHTKTVDAVPHRRTAKNLLVLTWISCALFAGCSKNPTETDAGGETTNSGEVSPAGDGLAAEPGSDLAATEDPTGQPANDGSSSSSPADAAPASSSPASRGGGLGAMVPPRTVDTPPTNLGTRAGGTRSGQPANLGAATPNNLGQLQLPPVEDYDSLAGFLTQADAEIERLGRIGFTMENRDALIAEIKRVGSLKQEAAERILKVPNLTEEQEAFAIRAMLQSLSHQSALGDVKAAATLEEKATGLTDYADPAVARDSRTVLVALALDKLQTGLNSDPQAVVNQVRTLAEMPEVFEPSSLIMVQQAMMILSRYGYADAAEEVNQVLQTVIPQLQNTEAKALGEEILASARFAALESMRAEIQAAKQPTPEQWKAEALKVVAKGKDLLSVQYLGSLALQLEAVGQMENTQAIYEVIQQQLINAEDPEVARTANAAVDAFTRRQAIVGKPANLQITKTISGAPIDFNIYRGKIVVMPYWAIEQADSLVSAAAVEEYLETLSTKTVLVGVNMDISPKGREAAGQLSGERMPWPSVAGILDPNSDAPNPLVEGVGIVSIPAVLVIDQEQNFAGVVLSQQTLEALIGRLLQK